MPFDGEVIFWKFWFWNFLRYNFQNVQKIIFCWKPKWWKHTSLQVLVSWISKVHSLINNIFFIFTFPALQRGLQKCQKKFAGQILWNFELKRCPSRQNKKVKYIKCPQNFKFRLCLAVKRQCPRLMGHPVCISSMF